MDTERVIGNIQKAVEKLHPGKDYQINEYKDFYTVGFTKELIQPMLFEKEFGFPMFKTFQQMKDKGEPKVVYKSGGQKDVKK